MMPSVLQRPMLAAANALLLLLLPCCEAGNTAETIRVMTYNLWHGGEQGGQPLDQTIQVIRMARADVVGLQEKGGAGDEVSSTDNAQRIAAALGWNYFDQGEGVGVITRFRLGKSTAKKHGTEIVLPSGQSVWHFNVHFAHAPYQPYQLLKIPYFDGKFIDTEAQAVAEANAARAQEAQAVIKEIAAHVPNLDTPVFVTGDFNEPSVLDWTEEAVRAGISPVAVKWPTTAAFFSVGFQDGYRVVHPDPVVRPGLTWTPITNRDDPKDHHDRIDFVLARGGQTNPVQAEVVGESRDHADIVVSPYPSDHRGVVCQFEIAKANAED
jgi:exodeoxyribonuclease III